MNPLEILKKYYGYDSFRPGQKELIEAILSGKDALGIMPTGGGKSICYQIPALLLEGVTIVISPLISLMKDQVDTLKEYGVQAELINSTLSTREFREIKANAKMGNYKLLYVAPERLETESFLDLIREIPISMVAVDEAHCVSQWGHDFRPSYRRISQIFCALPKRPIVTAFTATATPLVKKDIIQLLELDDPFKLTNSFDRPNLYFEVRKPENKLYETEKYLREHTGESGVIYCATRKGVDELYERLLRLGLPCTKYHAGLGEAQRNSNQDDFLYDRVSVMIATNAFGMGIDKPNVRFVLHYNMPKNMEGYYQEAGRAGRDGEEAQCILLFGTQDIMTNRYLIENANGLGRQVEYDKLNSMVDYCNTESCLRNYILEYFGQQKLEGDCQNCGSCSNDTEESDITVEAQKILSCVKRMKERFGSTQVADVLKGASTQRIKTLKFNELTTYGVMKDYPKETIKELISFLVAEGYLELVGTQYPILQLTEQSYHVLKGEKTISIKRVLVKETSGVRKKMSINAITDLGLFERLREIRFNIAKEQHIQPFMVFPDTSLKEMSSRYPTTEVEFLEISGVGEHKCNKYGRAFIEAIKKYVEANNIDINSNIRGKENQGIEKMRDLEEGSLKKSSSRDSHKLSYELYTQGKTISEIAEERQLTELTIENHLVKCVQEGLTIDFNQFIPVEYEEQIMEAVEECGATLLKPIKELLPKDVTYTAIKFTLLKHGRYRLK